ncbi:MAG: Small subunit (SSU) processome component [Trizodia sp. TS-e1964]|nr:MAG: Small subunit (SSU) processome component [Trizodia sp. TS-e1964]
MVRKLKHHEQKLLRKVSLTSFRTTTPNRAAVIRRYMLQTPSDYDAYNALSGSLRRLAHRLAQLPPTSPVRLALEAQLLAKLHDVGVVRGGQLSEVEKLGAGRFARRRLAVVMCRIGMVDSVQTATKVVEQGHVRIGPDVVTEPGVLVSRNMEDFVTWVDSSKIRKNVLRYREQLDDFDLL